MFLRRLVRAQIGILLLNADTRENFSNWNEAFSVFLMKGFDLAFISSIMASLLNKMKFEY